ncbi:protein of unknown function [Paraburkholderia dioscoreae]|uniref:Uncharacterized protein n=1 Tax=Paraburkholderia dioscoreae TaxID=2604047 RepID=A0A5Q4ZHC0_9BURK|nr:protein of unknown function [Paraburkholderia dioscoreae]
MQISRRVEFPGRYFSNRFPT